MKRRLWVVEMRLGVGWSPTVDVAFSRSEGKRLVLDWIRRNPSDKFRCVQYRPAP